MIKDLVSVVVVSGDPTSEVAQRCFRALKSSTVDYELIVVHRKKDWSWSETNNQGAKAAVGEYILFLNDDVFVEYWTLSELVEIAKEPDVGVVGGLLLYETGRIQYAGGYAIQRADNTWELGQNHAYNDPSKVPFAGPVDTLHVVGAMEMTKRSVLDHIGLFDESFGTCCADTDFCFRAIEAGYRVMFTPEAIATHIELYTVANQPEQPERIRKGFERFSERWINGIPQRGTLECVSS